MIIEQFLPALHYGDAIGNSTMRLHTYLCEHGIESRIVAMTIDESMRHAAEPFSAYQDNPRAIKILHFAVPSDLTDFFATASGKKAIIYHNVTPPNFFIGFSDDLVRFTAAGREHLRRLNQVFDMAFADSQYNAAELTEFGYANVIPFPIMINTEEYGGEYSQPYYNLLKDDGRINLLFVGRISPNKKIEDLLKILYFYKTCISPAVRLIVAGNPRTLPVYSNAIRDLASRLRLSADDLFFTGHIPFAELKAAYRAADVFVSMSEHEGFCLPLIESCLFQLPVIAYNAGAVAETLGQAGILVQQKRHADIAALAHAIHSSPRMVETLQQAAQARCGQYRAAADPGILLRHLQQL